MGKQTVLIVDDEPDFVTMLKQDFQSEGYAVEVAYNGVEAIQKVKQSPPDIIVLDIMMPEKDGFAVCSELKNDDRYADIPIILLTAVSDHVSSSQYSHSQALDVEADDFLSKPASFEEILESIRSLLA